MNEVVEGSGQGAPAVEGADQGDLTRDRSSSWQRFWGLVFLIVIVTTVAVVVTLDFNRRFWACDDADTWFVAYFPVGAELERNAHVDHSDHCVGRTRSVQRGVRVAELTYRPDSASADGVRVPLSGPPGVGARVVVGDYEVAVAALGDGELVRMTLSGGPTDTSVVMTLGDSLPIGGGRLYFEGIERYTVLVGHLDADDFAKSLEGTQTIPAPLDSLLGAGSVLEPQGGGGLLGGAEAPTGYELVVSHERPRAHIRYRICTEDACAPAGPGGAEDDGQGQLIEVVAVELGTGGLGNLLRDAQRTAEFIMSPSGRYRPAVSRAEATIESVEDMLANIESLTSQFNDSIRAYGTTGVIGRLALEDEVRANLNSTLASLAEVTASLDSALKVREDSPLLMRLAFTADAETSLNETLANLNELSTELSDPSKPLLARVVGDTIPQRVDSLLVEATQLTKRLTETTAVAEDVIRELRDAAPTVGIGVGIFGAIIAITSILGLFIG